jgi:male germ cell-associated kinase
MRGSFTTTLFQLPCRPSQFRTPRISPLRIQPLAFSSMLCPSSKFTGESGRTYRLIHPLGPQRTRTAPNIWKALDDVDESKQFVVKGPSSDDDRSLSWPLFTHEFEMQKLFSDSVFIRKMIDFIPSAAGVEPKIVLQAFEKTLWTARTERSMTSNEIKWIMKAVIIGLWTVHRKGLVYSGSVYLP